MLAGSILISIYLYSKKGGYDYLSKDIGYYKARSIETPAKLWLNGFLGLFFRTRMFGFLNWLMIPILIYFFLTIRKRHLWQRALFFVYILSVIIIGLRGYKNGRYALTLFPVTIVAVVWFAWDFFRQKPTKFRFLGVGILLLLLACNIGMYYRHYRYRLLYAMQYQKSTNTSRLMDYLKTLDIDEENNILVCNVIEFFYFTDIKAIMFRDIHAGIDNYEQLYKNLQELKIKYILAADYIHERSQFQNLSDMVTKKTVTVNRAGDLALYEVIPDL